MAQVKPTPEEQLLGLIEQGESPKPQKLKRRKSSFFDLSKIGSFLLSLASGLKNRTAPQGQYKEPNVKIIIKLLAVASVILAGCFIFDFMNSIKDINRTLKKSTKVKRLYSKEDLKADVRSYLYYFEMAQRRNIFSPLVLKSAENTKVESGKVLTTLMKDLALMGIFWVDEPQVVIEHKGENKTYFLKTGDIINKLKIDTILKDRVILDYEGEKAELM